MLLQVNLATHGTTVEILFNHASISESLFGQYILLTMNLKILINCPQEIAQSAMNHAL